MHPMHFRHRIKKISAASDLITSLKEQYPDIDKERMYIDKDNNMKINVDADRKSDEFKIGLRQDIKELRETNPNIGFKNIKIYKRKSNK